MILVVTFIVAYQIIHDVTDNVVYSHSAFLIGTRMTVLSLSGADLRGSER